MQKDKLAKELLKHVRRDDLDVNLLRDKLADDVIRAYVSCPCCGELIIPETALEPYIAYATSADHFLELCQDTLDELSDSLEAAYEGGDDVLAPTVH